MFAGRLDESLSLTAADGRRLKALAVRNSEIVRSPYPFSYQPSNDPRLKQVREQYELDRVLGAATSEFEAMVWLRGYTRSLYRWNEKIDYLKNFDALELLEKRLKNLPDDPNQGNYDPCHMFPLLYTQLAASLGHEARLLSIGHGLVEIWSNQFEKWVVMDVELDHHFEKNGIPLDAAQMVAANFEGCEGIRLIRGTKFPLPENPPMVYLKMKNLTAANCIPWFKHPIQFVDLRNDWLTNHYFPTHPKRSESNSLVYIDPRLIGNIPPEAMYRSRNWDETRQKSDAYWTLNQAELYVRSWDGDSLELAIDTVTPNFQVFEIVLDGQEARKHPSSFFRWPLHPGKNTLTVRPINQMGVEGIESKAELILTKPS